MPRRIEALARDALQHPVRVTVGTPGAVNADITQLTHVLPTPAAKYTWLATHLASLVDNGEVLVFANKKSTVDLIHVFFTAGQLPVGAAGGDPALAAVRCGVVKARAIHGDMD